jgi:hypothetical protein
VAKKRRWRWGVGVRSDGVPAWGDDRCCWTHVFCHRRTSRSGHVGRLLASLSGSSFRLPVCQEAERLVADVSLRCRFVFRNLPTSSWKFGELTLPTQRGWQCPFSLCNGTTGRRDEIRSKENVGRTTSAIRFGPKCKKKTASEFAYCVI